MTIYRIEIAGHLDERWAGTFESFMIIHDFNGAQRPVTRLTGPLDDQAALYGLLNRLRDIGATLVSVQALAPDEQ